MNKAYSRFIVAVIGAIAIAGGVSYFLLAGYVTTGTYNPGDKISVNGIEIKVLSVTSGSGVTSANDNLVGLSLGNYTAMPDGSAKFVLVHVLESNNGQAVSPTFNLEGTVIETDGKRIYSSKSVDTVFKTDAFRQATPDVGESSFCSDPPVALSPGTSVEGCVIFEVPSDQKPRKFFYISDNRVQFTVDLTK